MIQWNLFMNIIQHNPMIANAEKDKVLIHFDNNVEQKENKYL